MMNDKRVFRLVGVWDLLLTLPFALPVVNGIIVNVLIYLNSVISPSRDFPSFTNVHLFFVQLFGILAVLWAVVRIHKPDKYLASYDTLGRFLVALTMILFAVNGGSYVPLIFSISEIGFGIIQAIYILKKQRENILTTAST